MKISQVEEMRAMDRAAIQECGISELVLMENAGAAAYRALADRVPVARGRGLVLCGGGNNGGDGFVVARHIHSAGGAVTVAMVGKRGAYKGAALDNLRAIEKLDLPIAGDVNAEDMGGLAAGCDYVVDGLLGTGLSRPVTGQYAAWIEAVNAAGKPVLSLDIPSGVQGDTGAILGAAIRANWTVTFGLPKPGNLLFPGAACGGELLVTHISFPPRLYAGPALTLATNDGIAPPPRDPDGHKSSFGQALVVAGAASYYGAPYFAAMAFLRAGGGYARLATPARMVPHLAGAGREIVYLPQPEGEGGAIAKEAAAELLEVAAKMDAVAVGPGLSLADDAQALSRTVVAEVGAPVVVDGDALTALVGETRLLAARRVPAILTPHLGEMARLTGKAVSDLVADRIAHLRSACETWGAIVVLKGAHSLIGLPDGRVYVNLSGNSGMGTAGSGDVLTGSIAAMVGLGLDPASAARMGVFIHGVAGDLAAARRGQDGMTAQDILDHLPEAMQAWRRDELAERYTIPVIA